ncbi:AAA family ATPase [Brevibacterium sp.]|uniref:AAA family ATPase n=1 Tax=Brevibacterium sp. TaxID=1701 RepID=UPI002810F3F9|nr:AAA family ATPase [Brevibacterium sp.]
MTTQPPLVLLGGVPGAGKTAALRAIAGIAPSVRIVDSDAVRHRLSRVVGWAPYAVCRPFVHILAHCAILIQVLRRGGGPLIVHDPGTRWWSRRLLLWLALQCGYCPAAVFIDIDRDSALDGQTLRGRVVRRHAFDRHWRRWNRMRARIAAGAPLSRGEEWPRLMMTTRVRAVEDVVILVGEKPVAEAW